MKTILILCIAIVCISCVNNNKERKKNYPSHHYNYVSIDSSELNYFETDYVPVYSDIYYRDGTNKLLLTNTLSIRNKSLKDSAYIFSAKYYNSYGKILKEYVDSIILLSPLESIEFVVEETDDAGGAGANYIVKWGTNSKRSPLLIQSVMIGTYGQQGISFISDAKIIESSTE